MKESAGDCGTAQGLLRVQTGALIDPDEYDFAHTDLVIGRPMWDLKQTTVPLPKMRPREVRRTVSCRAHFLRR